VLSSSQYPERFNVFSDVLELASSLFLDDVADTESISSRGTDEDLTRLGNTGQSSRDVDLRPTR